MAGLDDALALLLGGPRAFLRRRQEEDTRARQGQALELAAVLAEQRGLPPSAVSGAALRGAAGGEGEGEPDRLAPRLPSPPAPWNPGQDVRLSAALQGAGLDEHKLSQAALERARAAEEQARTQSFLAVDQELRGTPGGAYARGNLVNKLDASPVREGGGTFYNRFDPQAPLVSVTPVGQANIAQSRAAAGASAAAASASRAHAGLYDAQRQRETAEGTAVRSFLEDPTVPAESKARLAQKMPFGPRMDDGVVWNPQDPAAPLRMTDPAQALAEERRARAQSEGEEGRERSLRRQALEEVLADPALPFAWKADLAQGKGVPDPREVRVRRPDGTTSVVMAVPSRAGLDILQVFDPATQQPVVAAPTNESEGGRTAYMRNLEERARLSGRTPAQQLQYEESRDLLGRALQNPGAAFGNTPEAIQEQLTRMRTAADATARAAPAPSPAGGSAAPTVTPPPAQPAAPRPVPAQAQAPRPAPPAAVFPPRGRPDTVVPRLSVGSAAAPPQAAAGAGAAPDFDTIPPGGVVTYRGAAYWVGRSLNTANGTVVVVGFKDGVPMVELVEE